MSDQTSGLFRAFNLELEHRHYSGLALLQTDKPLYAWEISPAWGPHGEGKHRRGELSQLNHLLEFFVSSRKNLDLLLFDVPNLIGYRANEIPVVRDKETGAPVLLERLA